LREDFQFIPVERDRVKTFCAVSSHPLIIWIGTDHVENRRRSRGNGFLGASGTSSLRGT